MSVIGHGVEIVPNVAGRPASPAEGTMIYQSDTNQLFLWDGASWVSPMANQAAGGVLDGNYPNPGFANPVSSNLRIANSSPQISIEETTTIGQSVLQLLQSGAPFSSEGAEFRYNSSSGDSFLRSSFPNGSLYLGAGSTSAQQVRITPSGNLVGNHFHISTGSSSFPSGGSQVAGATLNIPFRSTVYVLQQQSGYVGGAGLYTQYGAINGVTGWNAISIYYHNTTFDHRTYVMGMYSATLNAGNYYFMGYSNVLTDPNDFIRIVVFCKAVV